MFFTTGSAPIEEISEPLFQEKRIKLYLKREDKLHPEISGNKWRKLKYNLMEARKRGHHTLLTFGGAYSNHIYALASAGAEFGFKTIGVIRGDEKLPFNPTLKFAAEKGMLLHFISREEFKLKSSENLQKHFAQMFGDFYCIPEGGANSLGIKGCKEIISEIDKPFDFICTSCGTGNTLAGLISGLEGKNYAIGFSALKGHFLGDEVKDLLENINCPEYSNWHVQEEYHFGGYAKYDAALVGFINEFKQKHNIALDPIYTGKMFFGLYDMIAKSYFKEGAEIIALHTGGLQGIAGFNERYGKLLK